MTKDTLSKVSLAASTKAAPPPTTHPLNLVVQELHCAWQQKNINNSKLGTKYRSGHAGGRDIRERKSRTRRLQPGCHPPRPVSSRSWLETLVVCIAKLTEPEEAVPVRGARAPCGANRTHEHTLRQHPARYSLSAPGQPPLPASRRTPHLISSPGHRQLQPQGAEQTHRRRQGGAPGRAPEPTGDAQQPFLSPFFTAIVKVS